MLRGSACDPFLMRYQGRRAAQQELRPPEDLPRRVVPFAAD